MAKGDRLAARAIGTAQHQLDMMFADDAAIDRRPRPRGDARLRPALAIGTGNIQRFGEVQR